MATSSGSVVNLNAETVVKKKYVKKRSKAYKKRRSIRRKKNNFYSSKRLLRYFVRKTKKLKMNTTDSSSLVRETPDRCSGNDEIGYWKSQVLSLQLQNEMLCDYIKQLHTQLIKDKKNIVYNENLLNGNNFNGQEFGDLAGGDEGGNQEDYYQYGCSQYSDNQYCNNQYGSNEYEGNENQYGNGRCEDEEFNKEGKRFRLDREEKKKRISNEEEEDPTGKPPEKVVKRDEIMKTLYGNGWRKIMGMETVVQLNFDIIKDKEKINYWPIVPIK